MNRRLAIVFIALLTTQVLCAQKLPTSVQKVVDAENGFAGTSKQKSTKVAFLSNLATDGIVFSQGNPVNGISLWEKLPENNSLLFWWPVFADVASSGDFGFTTGPYEVSRDRTNPVPGAFGYYSTVWKRNERGEWKVAIDMGIAFEKKEENIPALHTSSKLLPDAKNTAGASGKTLTEVDKSYIEKLNTSSRSFDMANLSNEARIHRTGSFPYCTPEGIRTIDESNKKFQFEQLGGEAATSNDLGYCYGKVKVTVWQDGNSRELNLNYLRVWKKEEGEWKIVLDVVGG
jgi:ketosteroid isomerase-like protein